MKTSETLTPKVAIITGAGGGIGRASAFAGNGTTFVLFGRRGEALEETAAQIRANGGTTLVAAGDVSRSMP